ncbi:MAG: cytochrome P450 [Myxococcota bacterium]
MATLRNAIERAGSRLAMRLEWLETGATFNPLDPGNQADPYPMYDRVRQRDPLHRSRPVGGWVFTRYRDVLAALRDPRLSSDERGTRGYERNRRRLMDAGFLPEHDVDTPPILGLDPPDHTRIRGLVSKAFTRRSVERLRARVEALVDELLDELSGRDEIDLLRDYAGPLPVTVIAEMLGVPTEDRVHFRMLSNEVVRGLGSDELADLRRSVEGSRALESYLREIVEKRRVQPRDDLISALVMAEEAGDKLSTPELFSNIILLLVAGNETTTNLIGNGVLALLRHPEQLALLREQPERIEAAVEEVLRWDSPVQNTRRIATCDMEWDGIRIKKRQQIILSLGSANRDPEQFADPERFDIRRGDPNHLSFSQGIHYCLGAPLARMEGQCGILGLVQRFPKLRLAGHRIRWGDNVVLRGPRELALCL